MRNVEHVASLMDTDTSIFVAHLPFLKGGTPTLAIVSLKSWYFLGVMVGGRRGLEPTIANRLWQKLYGGATLFL